MSDERGGTRDSWGSSFPTPEDPRFYEALGRAIKALRAEQGLGRRELADAAGVSYPYLSEIENGRKRPSSRSLLLIAQALGLRPYQLLQEAEQLLDAVGPRTPSEPSEWWGDPAPVDIRPPMPAGQPPPSPASPAAAPSAPAAAPGASPRPARPAASPARQFLKRRSRTDEDAAAEEWDPTEMVLEQRTAIEPARGDDRQKLLSELWRTVAHLPPEDLRRLIDLARRLLP